MLQLKDRDFHAKASSPSELDQWVSSIRSLSDPTPLLTSNALTPSSDSISSTTTPPPSILPSAQSLSPPPRPSAPPGPHVTTFLLPFHAESLWLGYESGHVALWPEPTTGSSPLVYCSNHQMHPGAVTAMIAFSTLPEDGSIWTCCSGGQLTVWSPKLSCLEDVLEGNIVKGYLSFSSKPKMAASDCWIECENAKLSIFEKRHDVVPRSSIDLIKDLLAVNWDPTKSSLLLDLVPPHRQITLGLPSAQSSSASEDHTAVLDGWFDALKNIQSGKSERGTLSQVAHRQLSKSALLALLAADYSVWCCDARFMLSEWTLSNPNDQHGLSRTLNLTPLRTLQLLLQDSPASNLNGPTSCSLSFHRLTATSLLLVTPGQFVTVNLTDLKFGDHTEPMLGGLIGSICILPNLRAPEIWTAHQGGIIRIWRVIASKPSILMGKPERTHIELSLPSDAGQISTLSAITLNQVWVGTTKGFIYSIEIENPSIQSNPLLRPTAIKILSFQSLHISSSQSIIWSSHDDNSLIRFQ